MAKKIAGAVLVHPYEVLAGRFRRLKFFALFFLIAFLLGGLLLLHDQFTAENLRYLIKDLDVSAPSVGAQSRGFSFDFDASQRAKLYRGDLALIRRSGIDVYSLSGNQSLSDSIAFSSPELKVSEKYLLAYDVGGHKVNIYNGFSKLWEETYPYDVFCADTADNGTFAVVTGEKGYHSALYVYNHNFEKIFRWASADKVVSDVSICKEDPSFVAVSTLKSKGGDLECETLVFRTTDDRIYQSFTTAGEMPIRLDFISKDLLVLLTDDTLHRIRISDASDFTETIDRDTLSRYYCDRDYAILVKNVGMIGTSLEISVFELAHPEAEPHTLNLETQVLDIAVSGRTLYFLSYGSLNTYKLDSGNLTTSSLRSEFRQILPLSADRIAFLGEGYVSVYMVG